MARKKKLPMVKRSLSSWILEGSKWPHVMMILVIIILVFLRVLPLEIQKRIVNEVLALKNTSLLLTYCLIYFLAVVFSSLMKFIINWLQTLIGQRTMTQMRRELYAHILRLPLSFFRRVQSGSVSSSLIVELAPAASFIGTAIAVPVSNILTLIAFAVYLIWLNPLLAVCTLCIYPAALFVVPLIQKGVNRSNKERMNQTRLMANQITESISGINEVHGHGSFGSEENKYNAIVNRLLKIRITWSMYRYGVKIANNLFIGAGPVIVFTLGGYLLIHGKIELGAIVAFLSAQEKLYDPWKELIDFYQTSQDATVRYNKIVSAFDIESDIIPHTDQKAPLSADGKIEVKDVEFSPTEGFKLLDQVNLEIEAGEHVALVGFSGSGKSTLAKCIAQLYPYTNGEILIDNVAVSTLSKREIVQNIGFITQTPFVFSGTVDDNLQYSWNALSAQSDANPKDEITLDDKITILQQTGLFVDVLRFGLNSVLKREEHTELKKTILTIRKRFQTNFGQELEKFVEFYENDKYLHHSCIADNLLYGTPQTEAFFPKNLSRNGDFTDFLNNSGLRLPLLETGAEILRQTVNILGTVKKDDVFFSQTPIDSKEFEACKELKEKLDAIQITRLKAEDERGVLDLALRFVPADHKIITLQPLLEKMVLTGRQEFRSWCAANHPGAVSFFSDDSYLDEQTVLNNIFFGTLVSHSPKVEERVNQCIVFLLIEEDLLENITELGLRFHVGNRGDKLSGGQQQKLSIARVLMKNPKIIIMDEATSALDNASQKRIQNLVEQWKGSRTVISVIHRLDMLPAFDKVAVMKSGKIVEYGIPQELIAKRGVLYELTHGKS